MFPPRQANIRRKTKLSNLEQWFDRNRDLRFGNRSIQEWSLVESRDSPDNTNGSEDHGFGRRLRSTVGGRRFIITKEGYLGIAHNSVQQGDLLCIFMGGRMPVVLRPVGETYLFICESYVHGLMLGTAIDIASRSGLYLKEFTLS